MGFYNHFGIGVPIYLFLTMIGCLGRPLTRESPVEPEPEPINVDTLEFPPILLDGSQGNADLVIRTWLDRLWNASGIAGCPLYDPNTGEPNWTRL